MPPWLRGKGQGWVTGEYALLPRSTTTRTRRERNGAGGRTQEIQRLIGRSLRVAVDMRAARRAHASRSTAMCSRPTAARAPPRSPAAMWRWRWRCTAWSSAASSSASPLIQAVAAVSAGYVGGVALLDLDYSEDSSAELDCNVVQTGDGGIVEVQCTAEERAISRAELDALLDLVGAGISACWRRSARSWRAPVCMRHNACRTEGATSRNSYGSQSGPPAHCLRAAVFAAQERRRCSTSFNGKKR